MQVLRTRATRRMVRICVQFVAFRPARNARRRRGPRKASFQWRNYQHGSVRNAKQINKRHRKKSRNHPKCPGKHAAGRVRRNCPATLLLMKTKPGTGVRFAGSANIRSVWNVEPEALTSGQHTRRSKMTCSVVRNASQSGNAKGRVDGDCQPAHSTRKLQGICTQFVGTAISQYAPRVEEKQKAGGLRIRASHTLSSNVRNARATASAKAHVDRYFRPVHSTWAKGDGRTKCAESVNSRIVPRAGRRGKPYGPAIRKSHMHHHCVKNAKQPRCMASYQQVRVYFCMFGRLCARASWPTCN